MYFFMKQPALGTLLGGVGGSQIVDQTFLTNQLLETLQYLEASGVRQSMKQLARMKLAKFAEATECTIDGYDADIVLERAIALWLDDGNIPANLLDEEKLAILVEQAFLTVDLLDDGGVNDQLVGELADELDSPETFSQFISAVEVVIAQEQLHSPDARRHDVMASGLSKGSSMGYLPLATSIKDLHRKAVEVMSAGSSSEIMAHRIPCLEWLRLQFQPSNPYSKLARKFTGRFPLMLSTQERTRRKVNADAYYNVCLHKYMRAFAMLHSDNVLMVGMDDKAKIPVGEPGFRKAAVERNRRFIAVTTKEGHERSKAADHDQSSHFSLTPSVYLFHQIPQTDKETIYKGQPLIVMKNAVFESSDPQRHATELLKSITAYQEHLLRDSGGEIRDALGIKLPKDRSILLLNADGGTDHNCHHFRSVIWDLVVFLELDLDMLVHYRCYGGGSYINPVERCMAPLTASLSGVSTERRAHTDEETENLLAGANSMAALRKTAERFEGTEKSLRDATEVSLSPVIADLSSLFQRTQYDSKYFIMGEKATHGELEKLKERLLDIYPGYKKHNCTWADYNKLGGADEMLYNLIQCPKHCQRNLYSFQFKKCNNPKGCEFGFCKPVRMDAVLFEALKFIPMPSPDPDRPGKYVPYKKAFESSDVHCPSVVRRSTTVTEPIKSNFTTTHPDDISDLLVNKKARAWVACTACRKPRLLYSDTPLSKEAVDQLRDLEETTMYTCGLEFVPDEHMLHRAWISSKVRMMLSVV